MDIHQEFLDLARDLIDEDGRSVTFARLSTPTDSDKPWENTAPVLINSVTTKAVFLPVISTLDFGITFRADDLLMRSDQVLIVAPVDGQNLNDSTVVVDGGVRWNIEVIRELRPAELGLLYMMGVKR